jgi:enoyl-CoA hydratase/carnithine racemase
MTGTIRLEQEPSGVAVLTFDRPEAMNALDLGMMARFRDVVAGLAADAGLRCLVVTGAGQAAFCSGGDLVALADLTSEDDGRHMITLMGDALHALERLPVPVIAAINGHALGGGSEIALACDLRVVDANARLGLVQIRLGLTPGWGAGQRLLRLVGYPRAMELLLAGEALNISALEALGLASRVVPAGTAREEALDWARAIASRPPAVARAIKALLQAGLSHPYDEALRIERDVFPPLWAADAHLDAVQAFLARQKPIPSPQG